MRRKSIPELLSPAGSLEAVKAAVANGADAVYCGASRFNARDDGAQLTLDELEQACLIAHERGARIYLTLNILIKPAELNDALLYLGECIDRGIDAAIVQDIGLIRLIQKVYPEFEIHGSTQMTVHDSSGARVARELGIDRVVLARENTLEDIRSIRAAVPDIGLETFVHGALCIAYSGQCYMSGMISERSANRGSCAQSCRKDYVLRDLTTGSELDRGYLISAKDLGAWDHLDAIADAGVGCLKIEGRKKKPEFVATVTRGYRDFLKRVEEGSFAPPTFDEVQPLVQIFSRGFTGGMYGGRAGRDYITRTQPDNRGAELGRVTGYSDGELIIEVNTPVQARDGLGFEPPSGGHLESTGFAVTDVRTVSAHDGIYVQRIRARQRVPIGWRVVRSSHAELIDRARASYASLWPEARRRRSPVNVRVFGSAGAPLKAIFSVAGEDVTVRSELPLAGAEKRAIDLTQLREQFGRLGETPFVLADVDTNGLAAGLFIPVRELNRMRQTAVDELLLRRDWAQQGRLDERSAKVSAALSDLTVNHEVRLSDISAAGPALVAEVWRIEDAMHAMAGGADEIVLDPFLRHPFPPVARVRTLVEHAEQRGVNFRLRLPTVVRPSERQRLDKWLDLGTPLLTGHLGLLAELAGSGRDVVADYAVNCFNQFAAAEVFALGATGIIPSVELTVDEIAGLVAPWKGEGFEVFVYGRPEGMTIEHCVLSAAFDRTPTHCRDLCTRTHVNTEIIDPAGYHFPVATDYACRNRLLHSRPVEGSEFVPRLTSAGINRFRLVFNVFDEPIFEIVSGYRAILDGINVPNTSSSDIRGIIGGGFTRGHFVRAV